MKKLRPHRPSAALLIGCLALFLALGGAAYAGTKLAKNSVGTNQLKNKSINANKLKANAITTAKIKNGAVTGAKINAGSTPFGRVVAQLRASSGVSFPGAPVLIGTYAQPAGEDDFFNGGLTVTFDPSCTAPRQAIIYLLRNPANPSKPTIADVAGAAVVVDETGASATHKADFAPIGGYAGMQSFAPAATENQTFYIYPAIAECKTGSGVSTSNPGVDVIGVK